MIPKYVLKNFRLRRVRTILMVLSLIVSTGLIVAMSATVETIRRSNVNLIASATGRYELSVRRAGCLSATEQLAQFTATIGVHRAHEGAVAKVKEPRMRQQIIVHVIDPERVIQAWAVHERAIHTWRIDDHHLRGRFSTDDHHILSQLGAMTLDHLQQCLAEQIVADLAHQPRSHAQDVQCHTRVGDRSACS